MVNSTLLLEVLDPQTGRVKETRIDHDVPNMSRLEEAAPYPRDRYGNMTIDPQRADKRLTEAATGYASTHNFPDLLRFGVQFDLFSGYTERPTVYNQIARVVSSNKQKEEYGFDVGLGMPPVVAEGAPYPMAALSLGGGLIINNGKRGYLIPVTEELMRFDQIGKVRDIANNMGRAARMGREQAVMDVLTTTANYNQKNLNDQGANNYQTLTFSPTNLNAALALMMTQKDRTSGQNLGVMPDTLVVGPLLANFAQQLIYSPELRRVGGNSTNDVYGGGTNNPFYGAVTRVIVSPMFGASYQWALLDSNRAIRFQEVEPLGIWVEDGNRFSESWFVRDVIRYKVRDWYGVGMVDDRFAFYSDSTTPPVVS